MAQAKAAELHLAKFTTSRLRPQKPTPPNARLPRLANRLGLSFIGKAAHRETCRRQSLRQMLSRRPASAFTPTIRRQFRGHRITMAVVKIHPCTSSCPRSQYHQRRRSPRVRPPPARSTKALLPYPNPNGGAINPTSALWLPSRALFAVAIRATRTISALRSRAHWESKSATSSPCRSAGAITAQLHQTGNEAAWWEGLKIDALCLARQLWEQTHPNEGQVQRTAQQSEAAVQSE